MSDAALQRRICRIKRIDKMKDFIQVDFAGHTYSN